MPITKIFAVNQGDDERCPGQPKWFYTNEETAQAVSDGRGWFGGKAPVSHHDALVIDGTAYLLARVEPIELDPVIDDEQSVRQRAIAKLTPEERKALKIR